MGETGEAERVQKVLSRLGIGSRRQAEQWIREGRLTVNGRPASLGQRVGAGDQLRLDDRPIRQRAPARLETFLVHRSPGESLLERRGGAEGGAETGAGPEGDMATSIAERLPRRAGRRFLAVSPMPHGDGGLEILSADGALAARLQRAVRGLETEYSVRVRGEIDTAQHAAILAGALDSGQTVPVRALEPLGGEASNRWYRLLALGASGMAVRRLLERQGLTVVRILRTRLGTLEMPRELARSHWRALTAEELEALVGDAPAASAAVLKARLGKRGAVRAPRGPRR